MPPWPLLLSRANILRTYSRPQSGPAPLYAYPFRIKHSAGTGRSYYSSFVSSTQVCEDVHVNCRSNGSVTLNIYPPLVGNQASPIIIYLPSGPVAADRCSVDDGEIIAALSASSNATVVRLNYRIGNGIRYPTPIHDVLTAYDWIKQNVGPLTHTPLQIGACGQLIGGSLTTMLALTESRMGETGIAAAAVNSSIVNWIFPEAEDDVVLSDVKDLKGVDSESGDLSGYEVSMGTSLSKRLKTRKKPKTSWDVYGEEGTLSTSGLLATRSTLFKKPANYFDPFASPVLFFRSPGVDVPVPLLPEPDLGEFPEPPTSIRRKVPRNFPPTGSGLRLPDMRISIGERNPLYDQNEELVRFMRRSVVRSRQGRNRQHFDRYAEEPSDDEQATDLAIKEAERRIQFRASPKSGLWGIAGDPGWKSDVHDVGAWLRKALS